MVPRRVTLPGRPVSKTTIASRRDSRESLSWSQTDDHERPNIRHNDSADTVNTTASEFSTIIVLNRHRIIDTVFDSVTGRAITCLADTGCGPPAVVELQLILKKLNQNC